MSIRHGMGGGGWDEIARMREKYPRGEGTGLLSEFYKTRWWKRILWNTCRWYRRRLYRARLQELGRDSA